MIQQEWTYKSYSEELALSIANDFNVPLVIAKVMAIRGISNREISRNFFSQIKINYIHHFY